tara:strand:- start:167 stop:367 length:201 start_codon:yes stop_codon:yes gene_type:complete
MWRKCSLKQRGALYRRKSLDTEFTHISSNFGGPVIAREFSLQRQWGVEIFIYTSTSVLAGNGIYAG